MNNRIVLFLIIGVGCALIALLFTKPVLAQTPASPATAVVATNGTTVVANGVAITLTPGSPPTISAISTEDGTPVPISKSVQFIDKHGKNVNPSAISADTHIQAIVDSTASGRIIQRIMVDRD